MGIGFGGIVRGALSFAASLLSAVKSGGTKPTLGELLPVAVSALLPTIDAAIKFQGLNSKEKIDSWLGTLDSLTGADPAALDFIKGMPKEAEEELFDGLLQTARAYAYHRAGVPGYVETT